MGEALTSTARGSRRAGDTLRPRKTPGIRDVRLLFSPRRIQGVQYFHTRLPDGGDLFLTEYGLPFAAQLHPDNWLTSPWFEAHRKRLRGTSAIYRTETKPIEGRALNIIVRFNRVGQELPVDTVTRAVHSNACFNSPFEEIAQVMALRKAAFGKSGKRIWTKRPLLIYSPPERLELWQTGRNEREIAVKQAQLPEAHLDIHRSYILVYGWINGIDAQDASEIHGGVAGMSPEQFRQALMKEVENELKEAGFSVMDMKPAHIIIRLDKRRKPLRRTDGRLVYALIDYELLETLARS